MTWDWVVLISVIWIGLIVLACVHENNEHENRMFGKDKIRRG